MYSCICLKIEEAFLGSTTISPRHGIMAESWKKKTSIVADRRQVADAPLYYIPTYS